MLEKIKKELDEASSDDVRLYFITREKNGEDIEYGILRTEITAEIGKTLLKEIGVAGIDKLLKEDDLETIKYSPTTESDKSHIETIEKNEIQYLEEILSKINDADLAIFDMNLTRNLWAYVIRIGNKIMLFRKYTENRILKKKGWIPLFEENGVFNKLERTILTIDKTIDCLYFKDTMIILSKVQFERIFSFMDKFKEEINESIGDLEEKSLVDDTSSLWNLCKSDPRRIKKLNKVLKGDALTLLDTKKVKKLNTQYDLKLEFTDDGEIVVDRKNIWTILKVLDDDYLKSPMTDNKYEAHSKVRK